MTGATACTAVRPDQASISDSIIHCHALQRAGFADVVLQHCLWRPCPALCDLTGTLAGSACPWSQRAVSAPLGFVVHPFTQGGVCRQGMDFQAGRATLRGSAGSHLPTHRPAGAALHRCPLACCAQSTRSWRAAHPIARWTLGHLLHPVQVATNQCHLCVFLCFIWFPGAAFCLLGHSTGRHPGL